MGIPAQQNKTSSHPSPNSLGEGAVLHASVRNAGEVKNISCVSTEKNLVPQYLNALLPSKKSAFTLAEVLITLAIIGIVAAMTIPSVVANFNGPKGPNVFGIDTFRFIIGAGMGGRVLPFGSKTYNYNFYPHNAPCNRKYTKQTYTCAAWILEFENMDYLHCDDLSWDGKHKCK